MAGTAVIGVLGKIIFEAISPHINTQLLISLVKMHEYSNYSFCCLSHEATRGNTQLLSALVETRDYFACLKGPVIGWLLVRDGR